MITHENSIYHKTILFGRRSLSRLLLMPEGSLRRVSTVSGFVVAMLLWNHNAFSQSNRTILDQPIEQQRAVEKIIKLGGDWEAPSKTVLIGFDGDKFTNDTFALLSPLTDLRILFLDEIPADDKALEHCKELESIEEISITNCRFNGTGLKHLSKCKGLKTIRFTDTPINDEALEIISKFESLERLFIVNWDLPSKVTHLGVRKLSVLRKAKQISIDLTEMPSGFESDMRRLLPKCDVHIGKHIPEPKK